MIRTVTFIITVAFMSACGSDCPPATVITCVPCEQNPMKGCAADEVCTAESGHLCCHKK